MSFLEDGRECKLPSLLYADDMVLCGESEDGGKSKVMVLNGEEGLECEVQVDGVRLKHVSEFKYLGCVLDESGTDGAECSRKVASVRRVAGAIRS